MQNFTWNQELSRTMAPPPGYQSISTFTLKVGAQTIKIDVLESLNDNPIRPITLFHSTFVQNYLSSDALVVFHPKFTLVCEGYPGSQRVVRPDIIQRYRRRGFRFFKDNSHWLEPCGRLCPLKVICADDRKNVLVTSVRVGGGERDAQQRLKLPEYLHSHVKWQTERLCRNANCQYFSGPAHTSI